MDDHIQLKEDALQPHSVLEVYQIASQVCGRIRGYQFGGTSAFYAYDSDRDLDSNYVNGISLTHGAAGRRQHIWTFATGLTEIATSYPLEDCPCDTSNYGVIPAFVVCAWSQLENK